MKKILYILLVILILPFYSEAKDKSFLLSGIVKDEQGNSLVGVLIKVDSLLVGTTTNSFGQYKLRLNKGNYNLTISYLGYKKQHHAVKLEADVQRNYILEEDLLQLKGITVLGENQTKKIERSVFSVEAIDIASQIGSIQTLSSVVEQSMGVHIRRNGGLGSDYDLTLNGMGGDAIRYFMDGVPLDVKGKDFSLDNIPPNIVERIEIYKGVVPATLGGDALGGAINIVSKEKTRNFYDFSYGVGSFHTHRAEFNAQIVAPKSGMTIKPTISYNYSKNDYTMKDMKILDPIKNEFVYGVDCKRFHDDYKSLYGQLELGVTSKSWADYLYMSASITNVNKDIQTGAVQDVVYGEARRESLNWNLNARYKKRNFIVDNLTFVANASQTWETSEIIDTATVTYYWNEYKKNTTGSAELRDYATIRTYKRPLTTLRSNIDYNIKDFSTINFNYLLTSTGSKMTEESVAESDIKPTDDRLTRQYIGLTYNMDFFDKKWHNTIFAKEYINSVKIEEKLGVKILPDGSVMSFVEYEGKDITKFFTGYGLGTRYKLHDAVSFKGSYEYSVRLPGAVELLGDGENILANYELKPERSYNYNLRAYGFTNYRNSKLSYDIGGFYRNIFDFIMPDMGSESFRFVNASNVRIMGTEGELTYSYNNALQLSANMTYENAVDMIEEKMSDGKPNLAYRQKVPNRPSFYSTMLASYSFSDIFSAEDKLKIEYQYDYVKWFYLTWEKFGVASSKDFIPTQNNNSFLISYSMQDNKYSIALDCDNVFDKLLFDNYRLQKPGRSFYLKFRVFIN